MRALPRPTSRGGIRLLLAVGCVLVLEQLIFAATGAAPPGLDDLRVRDWWWSGILLLFTLVAAERARVERRERLPWALITLAMAAWSAGELYWVVELAPLGDDAPVPLVGRRPLARLLPAARRPASCCSPARASAPSRASSASTPPSSPSRSPPSAPRSSSRRSSAAGEGAATSTHRHQPRVPVADLVLLAVTGAAIAVNGWRVGRASLPLVARPRPVHAADSAYAYTIAAGTYDVGGLIDVGWVLAFAAFALGAWQRLPRARPSGCRTGGRRSRRRRSAPDGGDPGALAGRGDRHPGVALAAAALAALVARMAAAVIELELSSKA